jgi:hypothetical protein
MSATRIFELSDPFLILLRKCSRKELETFLSTVPDSISYFNGMVQHTQTWRAPVFFEAIYWNPNNEVCDLFLNNGVDINCRDSNRDTALHKASEGNFSRVQYLVEKGANIAVVDKFNRTPLDVAFYGVPAQAVNIVTYLASKGAPGIIPLAQPPLAKIYKQHFPSLRGRAALAALFKETKIPTAVVQNVIGSFLGYNGSSHNILAVNKATAIASGYKFATESKQLTRRFFASQTRFIADEKEKKHSPTFFNHSVARSTPVLLPDKKALQLKAESKAVDLSIVIRKEVKAYIAALKHAEQRRDTHTVQACRNHLNALAENFELDSAVSIYGIRKFLLSGAGRGFPVVKVK